MTVQGFLCCKALKFTCVLREATFIKFFFLDKMLWSIALGTSSLVSTPQFPSGITFTPFDYLPHRDLRYGVKFLKIGRYVFKLRLPTTGVNYRPQTKRLYKNIFTHLLCQKTVQITCHNNLNASHLSSYRRTGITIILEHLKNMTR